VTSRMKVLVVSTPLTGRINPVASIRRSMVAAGYQDHRL
jgi:hypothetical protein